MLQCVFQVMLDETNEWTFVVANELGFLGLSKVSRVRFALVVMRPSLRIDIIATYL